MRVALGSIEVDDTERELIAYGLGARDGKLASRVEVANAVRVALDAWLDAKAERREQE